ncbi:MAG TPA: ATP-dependent DNA helicase [Saprospiraceae bacterium]|nr:ATP-dependent DNA helicase [Saprospiraceae bacterium]
MTFYNEKLFEENPELTKGNLQIIACAGAGKTDFISERIDYQIWAGIAKPDQIVAITYTDKAAEELRFRIQEKINALPDNRKDTGELFIGTIHSFCLQILKEYFTEYKGFDLLTQAAQYSFILYWERDLGLDELQKWLETENRLPNNLVHLGSNKENHTLKAFLNTLNIFQEERLDQSHDNTNGLFWSSYERYKVKLKEEKFLDFNSILRLCFDLLRDSKNTQILDKIRLKHQFLTIDEYQDVNSIQEYLIQLFSNSQNLCVVGDDDQSVYKWRGADVQNIITFQNRYGDVAIHKLEMNRRSCDRIVKLGEQLICNNQQRLEKSILPNEKQTQDGDIYKLKFEYQTEEIQFILEKIQSLVGKEYIEREDKDGNVIKRPLKYSDVAILIRTKKAAEEYVKAFDNVNIPAVFEGIGGLFKKDEVGMITEMFKMIVSHNNHSQFQYYFNATNYWNYFDNEFIFGFQNAFSLNDRQRNLLKEPFKRLIEKYNLDKKSRISLQSLLQEILQCIGYGSNNNLHEDAVNEKRLYNLGKLSEAIADYEIARNYCTFYDIRNFIRFIELHAEKLYDEGGTGEDKHSKINAVKFITLHSAKGLGFPIIFMPQFFQYRLSRKEEPTFLNDKFDVSKYETTEEDERRLAYVGITRAKKFLFVTAWQKKNKESKKSSYGDKTLNRFKELNDNLCVIENKPDPTERIVCADNLTQKTDKFTTNFSELSYYWSCGYMYKLANIYGFKPPILEALGFGKQMHNIIDVLHTDFKNGKLPTAQEIKAIVAEQFYMRYATPQMNDTLKTAAETALLNYVEIWKKDFSLTLKTEQTFDYEIGNGLISGSVDLLKRQETAETISKSVLEIVEFKTGKRVNEYERKYELQAKIYLLAIKEALGNKIDEAHIHYLDKKGGNRDPVDTSPRSLTEAKKEVESIINSILKNNFTRNPKSKETCENCDFSKICPKTKPQNVKY